MVFFHVVNHFCVLILTVFNNQLDDGLIHKLLVQISKEYEVLSFSVFITIVSMLELCLSCQSKRFVVHLNKYVMNNIIDDTTIDVVMIRSKNIFSDLFFCTNLNQTLKSTK